MQSGTELKEESPPKRHEDPVYEDQVDKRLAISGTVSGECGVVGQ